VLAFVGVDVGALLVAACVGAGVVAPGWLPVALVAVCVAAGRCVAAVAADVGPADELELGDEGSSEVGVSCTSGFDEPLLHAAAASSRVSPAAIVPALRMSVITAEATERFSAREARPRRSDHAHRL